MAWEFDNEAALMVERAGGDLNNIVGRPARGQVHCDNCSSGFHWH